MPNDTEASPLAGDLVEADLTRAHGAVMTARHLIEDNADKDYDDQDDAAVLRQVYALLLDAGCGVAGARAVIRLRGEMACALEKADTERPASNLRLVK